MNDHRWRLTVEHDPTARYGWHVHVHWQRQKYQRWKPVLVGTDRTLAGALTVVANGMAQQQKQHPELFA